MGKVIPVVAAGSPTGGGPTSFGESRASLPLPAAIPLSLYVHFPWCVRKCPYCDFNSHAAPEAIPEPEYLAALRADLEAALPAIWGRRVGSIFIGGGTPSLLSERGVDQLLSDLRARLPLSADCEVTLEANPGTFEASRFKGYRASGINRISLGIQSFDDRFLRQLGRIHSGDEAARAIEAVAACFDSFNLDLMYGLPGQDAAALGRDLDRALSFAPPHLSAYQLTIEPNTPFAANPPATPDEDCLDEMGDQLRQALAAAGLSQYEVSAYARAGHRCRHNLNYWHFGDYLGIGPGAHSKLSLPDRVLRQMRWKSPSSYLARAAAGAVQTESELSAEDRGFEFLMNALRLVDGFEIREFETTTGCSWSSVAGRVEEAIGLGLMVRGGGRIGTSAQGARLLNTLLQRFLP